VPIRAFLFDFDGLLVDTETPSLAGWQRLYLEHGQHLPLDRWTQGVGTRDTWDPMAHLEELVGTRLEREALDERRAAHELTLIEAEGLRPGIGNYLETARRLGLARAIVSSSTRAWIDLHLRRLEEAVGWDAIVTAEDDDGRAKPAPTLYLEALELLGLEPGEAIAFEDSPNGVAAARAAGIFVVAVPNAVTRDLGLAGADLLVESLAELPPEELLARFEPA